METTSLYVELIVIGLETITWMASFSIYLTDTKYISVVNKMVEKLPASIFLLGIMYVFGIIFDRASDLIFKKMEVQIRKKSGLQTESSILIWKASGQEEYFKFTRSKIRILRSSSINIPLLVISVILNILKYHQSQFMFLIFVMITGCVFSCFSLVGYKKSLENYYAKAKMM